MSIVLLAMAAVAATHSVPIDHRGTALEAIYSVRADVRQKTVGAHTPNRFDGRRCQWTATLVVERQLAGHHALARKISDDRAFSGSDHGPCTERARSAEQIMAGREDKVRAHLIAIAEQDRTPLLAELDAARSLASN